MVFWLLKGGEIMVINEAVVTEEIAFNDMAESCHDSGNECGHECREH